MRFSLLFLLLFSLQITAQNSSRYPSLLWKISGKDMKKPSYLYGTMHVSNRVAWHLSEEFFDALKSAEVVGLETNPGQWLDNMQKTGELARISQPRMSIGYNNDFYANVFRQTFPDRKMLEAVLSYDPDIINGLLYRQNESRENFEENTYVDLFIFQTASKLNKPVISLEDFEDAEIQALLAAMPDAEPSETERKNAYSANSRLEDAYRDGNLDLLDSLSRQVSSRNAQKYLITVRNKYFAASIDSVLQHKTLFSGVGAAHLPGPDGVIELLRRKGYTVEPVMGHFNRKSNTERDKLETLFKPLVFSRQFLPDSNVSAELPGKIYPIYESPNLSYHIQPDMVNGNFYTLVRLRHFGSVFGISAEDMRKRVDSLLFENIAGKIISKSFITAHSGWPGIEVVARTSRGDEQRYRMFFNAMEMYLFKLGGKGKYASSKEANRFFNSITFESKSIRPGFFSPPTAGFKIKSNGRLSYFSLNPGTVGLAEELLIQGKSQSTLLQHAVNNDFTYLEEDTFELNRFTKNILENYGYQASVKTSPERFQELPSYKFQGLNNKGQKLNGRLVIKGIHYYLLLHFSGTNFESDYTAFDSFELNDFVTVHPIRMIKDPDFLFTVEDEVTEDAAARFNQRYQDVLAIEFPEKENKKEKDVVFRTASKHYYSPSTNEYVNITFEKYDQYDFRNKEEFMLHLDSVLGKKSGMQRTNFEIRDEKGLLEYNFVLRDTATCRAIKTRLIFKNGTMHELSVPFDTLVQLRGWTERFFKSFTPMDSAAGPDLFSSHFDLLLKNLSNKDSVVRSEAIEALSSIGYASEYASSFLEFLNGPVFPGLDETVRAQLLVSGGTLKSNAILPVYKKLYKNYADSFFLQLSVLKGLAYLHTEEGNLAFAQLLTQDPALVGNESIVNDVFDELKDSLPLCTKMFPLLLSLRQFEEYRSPVYQLLAELTARKLMPRAALEGSLTVVTNDALLALKRYGQVRQKQAGSGVKQDELSTILQFNGYSVQEEYVEEGGSRRNPLQAFAAVLAPYYNSGGAVKLFYDKLFRLKEESLLMPALVDLLRYHPKAQDSLVNSFSQSVSTRAQFHRQLSNAGLQHIFPEKGLSQVELLRSFLLAREGAISSQKDRAKDTLQYFKKVSAKNRYQSGDLHIFKSAASTPQVWKLVFVPQNSKQLTSNYQLYNDAFVPDPSKSDEANVNLILERFALLFRKRAGSNLFN